MKIQILEALIGKLDDHVHKFQRKLTKYGRSPLTYKISPPYRCEDESSSFYNTVVVDVELEGQYQVSGYEFLAALDWDDDAHRNIIRKAPGTEDLPEMFITRSSCDHCGTNRYRKYTVVLKNTSTGEYVQVGRSCAKDYVCQDVSDYATYLSWWTSIEEYCANLNKEGLGHVQRVFDARYVLEQTCAEVHARGFISKSAVERGDSNGIPTAHRVSALLNKDVDKYGNLLVPEYYLTGADRELADTVSEWILTLPESSDYNRNLKTVFAHKYIENSYKLNIFVSAVGAYLRAQKESLNASQNPSEFMGQAGEKIQFTAAAELVTSYDGPYATCYLYKFNVGDNVIVWSTSKFLLCGEELTLCGTVKSHRTFRGIKQTEITRCKVVA